MTRDLWLAKHSYLEPVAQFHAQVNSAMASISGVSYSLPASDWSLYAADFEEGIPLLYSPTVAINLEPAEQSLVELVDKLSSSGLPGNLASDAACLSHQLRFDGAARSAVAWVLNGGDFACANPGLLRSLGWAVLAWHLRPVVEAFSAWRDEEQWLRNYCPTCGASPAMAQLAGTDPARLRLLYCGRCATRWRYRRSGCPFCENYDDHQLAVLVIDGEGGLRIDYCKSCDGYLKTYNGEGSEGILLADWTSIHLDVLAQDRGLKRLAGSLYDLSAEKLSML